MKLELLDLLLLAKQQRRKVAIGNTMQGITRYEVKKMPNGVASEHRFMFDNCIIVMVEDTRG